MKYSDFFKLLENKDRFIDVNPNLTPDQKTEIKAFFTRHPNYENRVDWNKARSLTYDDFKPILDLEGKSVSAVKRGAGIQGLTEGHDYILLGRGVFKGKEWNAYQPLTYYASRLIASRFVKPEVDAKWCTAYQQDRMFWDKHAFKNKESFIYLCGESIPTKKVAITASTLERDSDKQKYSYHLESGLNFSIWSANDSKVKILEKLPGEIVPLISKSYENRELVIQFHDEDVKKTEEIKRQEEERIRRLKTPKLNRVTGRYDVAMSLDSNDVHQYIENGKFKIPFGVVAGNFDCGYCNNLTSLEGAPEKVDGWFNCSWCINLTSLKGAPKEVGGDFDCKHCDSLTSLEGAPKEVGGDFDCYYCDNLIYLEGAPEKVGGNFDCSKCENLTSLKGAPKHIGGDFNCYYCDNLASLECTSEYVGGDFNCGYCSNLTSLKGAPEKVGGSFDCYYCDNLTSLEGAPEYVGGDFYCGSCSDLTSLKGAPEKVGSKFSCFNCNNLTSLEGAPREVGGNFECHGCKNLTSLEGIPKKIGGSIYCMGCKRKFTEEDLENVGIKITGIGKVIF